MADKEYLLGNKARDLLKYTNQVTKVASDDVDRRSVREIIKKISELDDITEVRTVCHELIGTIDKRDRKGFSKSAYRCYGEDMREIAKGVVRDIHAANGKLFATEHEERLRLIGRTMDGCTLLIEYIQICLDLGIIDMSRCEVWTKMVLDVKYMCGSWKKNDGARARKLIAEETEKENQRQIELVKDAIRQVKAGK